MLKSGMKSLFTIAANAAKGVDQSVPEIVSSQRQDICNDCEYRIKTTNQCSKCGCFLSAKTKFRQEECPLQKWLKYNG
jgi:hypothetical protein